MIHTKVNIQEFREVTDHSIEEVDAPQMVRDTLQPNPKPFVTEGVTIEAVEPAEVRPRGWSGHGQWCIRRGLDSGENTGKWVNAKENQEK